MTSADVTSAFNQLCGHWSILIIVNDRKPIYVDWDFNSWWVAQPSIPYPTHFEHEHTQSWLLLLDMKDDFAPDWYHNTVACHRTLCWHLIYMFYMVSRSRRWQRPQQRISCKVNPESSICSADDQAESPLADSQPASHCKPCQPLQLRHSPGPDPIPVLSTALISCLALSNVTFSNAGDVRAINTPIQLN